MLCLLSLQWAGTYFNGFGGEGPAMSWQLVQGVPGPHPETAGIGSSKKPLMSLHIIFHSILYLKI